VSSRRILGIPYESVNLTFPGIRGDLAKQTDNDKVTVPTIVDGGKTITDSWVIAEYVSRTKPLPLCAPLGVEW
jgi:glutathione S-transferase